MVTADAVPVTVDIVKFAIGIVGATATICAFVFDQRRRSSNELSEFKRIVFRVVSRHNKEDDENFGAINDNIHDIGMGMAQHFNRAAPKFRSIRKRRYLMDDGGNIPDSGLDVGLAAGHFDDDSDMDGG